LFNKDLSIPKIISLIKDLQQKQLNSLNSCLENINKIKDGTKKMSESLNNMKSILNR
jgi:hypothetical protein